MKNAPVETTSAIPPAGPTDVTAPAARPLPETRERLRAHILLDALTDAARSVDAWDARRGGE